MQKKFPASYLVVDEVVKEINKAKNNKEVILLVHYDKGPSIKKIQDAVRGYRHGVLKKTTDDAGSVIFDILTRVQENLNSKYISLRSVKSIKICGVNTSACVMKTVRTLSFLRIPIKVLSNACANKFPGEPDTKNIWHHKGALKRMDSWKNVQVL
jgi:nicotinamidase-related amidase